MLCNLEFSICLFQDKTLIASSILTIVAILLLHSASYFGLTVFYISMTCLNKRLRFNL